MEVFLVSDDMMTSPFVLNLFEDSGCFKESLVCSLRFTSAGILIAESPYTGEVKESKRLQEAPRENETQHGTKAESIA
jgi:hypothetical protein